MIVPKKLTVISNTTEKAILPHDPGFKIVHFERTPKMSTYLLAFIIGELEHLKTKTKRGVQIRVHTVPGKKAQAKFALDVTKRSLEYLEDYFGMPFPLPVLDMIAIPDFAAGAMENWGAVTFRENALLVDDTNTSFLGKQRVAEVIAHELVHQWFGNLVTMEWWTHLWLNESFATYMAYHTIDKLFPDWNFWTKFVLQEQSYALSEDSLHSSHPIEVEVKNPSEISEIFDGISYAKGASVLRMLMKYIGEENFRKGLQLYLKKHSYQNTSSIHLWDAFEKISKLPIRKFMKTWTTETGFPVVKVGFKENQLFLQQQRFTYLSKPKAPKQLWTIPLSPQITGEHNLNWTLSKESQQFKLPNNWEFLNLNQDEHSLFLPCYDPKSLARLLIKLQNKELSNIDRMSLIRSVFMCAKNGLLSADVFLETLRYLPEEDSYIVWAEVAGYLTDLQKTFNDDTTTRQLNSFILQIFSKLLERSDIGFARKKAEKQNIHNIREVAVLQAGLVGHKPAIKFCREEFNRAIKGKKIDPDLRLASFCVVAKYGREAEFKGLIKLFKKSSLLQEKQQILLALTYFKVPAIQKQILNFAVSKEVRDQDRFIFLSQLLSRPSFKDLAWKKIKLNWEMLESKYSSSRSLGYIISGASSFNTLEELRDLRSFLKSVSITTFKQAAKKTQETIEIRLAWQQRDARLLKEYLRRG